MAQPYRREFHVARAKLQHGFLLGGVLAAIGLGVLLFAGPALPDSRLIGGVNLALGAGIALFNLFRARDRRPRLVVDESGIWFHEWGPFTVPHDAIAEVHEKGSRMQSFVAIRLRDAEGFRASLPAETRDKLNPGRLVRPPELLIPHAAVEASFEEIEEAIAEGRKQAASPA